MRRQVKRTVFGLTAGGFDGIQTLASYALEGEGHGHGTACATQIVSVPRTLSNKRTLLARCRAGGSRAKGTRPPGARGRAYPLGRGPTPQLPPSALHGSLTSRGPSPVRGQLQLIQHEEGVEIAQGGGAHLQYGSTRIVCVAWMSGYRCMCLWLSVKGMCTRTCVCERVCVLGVGGKSTWGGVRHAWRRAAGLPLPPHRSGPARPAHRPADLHARALHQLRALDDLGHLYHPWRARSRAGAWRQHGGGEAARQGRYRRGSCGARLLGAWKRSWQHGAHAADAHAAAQRQAGRRG